MMTAKSLMPSFKINVPTDTHLTHKTILAYLKNSLQLKSSRQIELKGIRHSLDLFGTVPVVGRLKDLKLQLILYKVNQDAVMPETGDSTSEEEEPCSSNQSSSESLSHTETENSQEGETI